jgi:hypothetical protein
LSSSAPYRFPDRPTTASFNDFRGLLPSMELAAAVLRHDLRRNVLWPIGP